MQKRKSDRTLLWGYAQRNRMVFLLFVTVTVSIAFVAPLKSFIIQWLIDAPTKKAAMNDLILGAIITVLSYVLELSSRNLWTKISAHSMKEIRDKVMSKYLKMEMEKYFDVGNSEAISVLINHVKTLQADYYTAIYNIALYGGMLLFAVGMLFFINPSMLLYVLIASIFPLMIPRLLDKKVLSGRKEHLNVLKEYTGKITDFLKGYETIRHFDVDQNYENEHHMLNARLASYDIKFQKKMNLSITTASFVGNILFYVLLLLGILLFYNHQLSIGYMVAATNLTNYVISPVKMISQMFSKVRSTASVREELSEVVHATEISTDGLHLGAVEHITWNNVSFRYPSSETDVLSNLSMNWGKNDKIAIFGESGSGKTTILKLLLKYFHHYRGEILINGTELRRISYRSLYRQVGVIAQNPHIFNDTIRNNICLYEHFSDEELSIALELSGVGDYVRDMPDGIDTQILENGKNISGGQAQRIAIARAIIRKKNIILVDEGTTGLDMNLSEEIMNTILSLNSLVVIISHDEHAGYHSKINKKYRIIDHEIKAVEGSFEKEELW